MIGFTVSFYWFQIGTGDFLHSFFSTVCMRLEGGSWGSKFPVIMNELYQGELPADKVDAAMQELRLIREGLRAFPPEQVVWDMDDLSKQPPWGNKISPDITDLSNYFVTSDGEDFIGVFENALKTAAEDGEALKIESL
ncbi:MAG: immunity 70 family protein [Lachnospiraceae bacterium]|nr:immunity 70 family protein [Lachnospiraceae bacterium]